MHEEVDPSVFLPPDMYEGGFRGSVQVINTLRDTFGIAKPTAVYYPGSSSDISLLALTEAKVIHADNVLTDEMLSGFSQLGAEAHKADVEEWDVGEDVDIVAFINPSGIDESNVLPHSQLVPGGLVLWYSWSGRPINLKETEGMHLVGAIPFDEEEGFAIDREQLDDYFVHKTFAELDETERRDFIDTFTQSYKLKEGSSYASVYAEMQRPEVIGHAVAAGIHFPYRKEANCFVFQKREEVIAA